MKSRILLFLTLTVCRAAQVPPTAVSDRAYSWDGTLCLGTAAVSPPTFLDSAILLTGSPTAENENASKLIARLATMTGRGLRTVPEVFSEPGEMLDETWGVPSPEIRSSNVPYDDPVRNAVEPRATVTLPIKISDVTGLSAALSQINNSIDTLSTTVNDLSTNASNLSTTISNLSTTVNTLADTVAKLVPVPTFIDFERPVGSIDGSNPIFVLSTAPTPPSSLALKRNGLQLSPGFDYSLSGNKILFATGAVPEPGDLVTASFRAMPNASAAVISH